MHKKLLVALIAHCVAMVCNAQTDTTIGLTVPKNISQDYNALAAVLCFDQQGDRAKANAVYNWVTHNISYDADAMEKIPRHRDKIVEQTLKSKKAVCEGYSKVFTEICRAAGLKAVNIEGYARDWIFDNGDELHIPRHMWSAVMIDGKWQLVDATWGAGMLTQSPGWMRRMRNKMAHKEATSGKKLKFRFKYDPQYFMQDPETFRLKHLPADPLWQLTDSMMPIAVFEAGDSAVQVFNETYSTPVQNDPKLLTISRYSEQGRIIESADRVYAYNSRYVGILAVKQAYIAAAQVDKAFTDTTLLKADTLVRSASLTLKKSGEYIKEQKKTFPEEYSRLKKKNKAKNQVAQQYIRQIKADDKKRIAESRKYTNTANSKYDRINKKSEDAKKRGQNTYAGKINDIETGKVQKKSGSAELAAIKNAVATTGNQIDSVHNLLSAQRMAIEVMKAEQALRLDSLTSALALEDALLLKETGARLNMYDSYDSEVKVWNSQYTITKNNMTALLQKRYLATFDTITAAYDRIQAAEAAQADRYRKNLKALEQYKKWNAGDEALTAEYTTAYEQYTAAGDTMNYDMEAYAAYIKAHRKVFAGLGQLAQKQLKIVDHMEEAEHKRKGLEDKTISKKQAFDIKENKKQSELLKDIRQKVDKVADGLE